MTGDWADVLVALLDAGARFLVVGAHALAVQGVPRATQDLDIWVDPAPENADRVWEALTRFGAPLEDMRISRDDFVRPDTVVQIGLPPNRIDLLTTITGVSTFDVAWAERVDSELDGHLIPFLGRETLIANKRATGRLKDLADIEALGEDV
ncbi:MAG: hypothetical protein OEO79_17355 [Gemmatimonadota bacterium]|nr:hypothetical protein [Gemmatimonadota bacterium]